MTRLPPVYPAAIQKQLTNDRYGGPFPAGVGRGVIEHVALSTGSLYNYFAGASPKVSSHLWIALDGTVEQYVPLTHQSYAQAAGNPLYVSIETAGFPDEPLTAAQVESFARFYYWGMWYEGWPCLLADQPGAKGLGTHSMGGALYGGHACPGDIRAAQRLTILVRVSALIQEANDMGYADDQLNAMKEQFPGLNPSDFARAVPEMLRVVRSQVDKLNTVAATAADANSNAWLAQAVAARVELALTDVRTQLASISGTLAAIQAIVTPSVPLTATGTLMQTPLPYPTD
jgi:hypothetical protein